MAVKLIIRRNYLASFAGTIHAGWSVFFFRSVEMVGAYRLTGIAVAALLAILALVILGSNFYFKEHAIASAGRFQAMFDASPEAIGVIDPETLQIMEANRSLASCLGFSQKELHTLKLGKLLNQDSQELSDQLQRIAQEDGAAKMEWQARKKDGSVLDLEVMGSKLEHQGKDQVLIFCREAETLRTPPTAILQESGQLSPVQEPRAPSLLAGSNFSEATNPSRAILPGVEEKSSNGNGQDFDLEAKVQIKRIMDALNKVERLRKNSGDLQKL
jgi:PAS domain S-box-containing protein